MVGRDEPLLARFWGKVDRDGPIQPHTPWLGPCWQWTGQKNAGGYGTLWVNEFNSARPAHRISWAIRYGSMPTRLVLHKCDNRLCVRPVHLFLGTHWDNMRDAVSKERMGRPIIHGRRSKRARKPLEPAATVVAPESGLCHYADMTGS